MSYLPVDPQSAVLFRLGLGPFKLKKSTLVKLFKFTGHGRANTTRICEAHCIGSFLCGDLPLQPSDENLAIFHRSFFEGRWNRRLSFFENLFEFGHIAILPAASLKRNGPLVLALALAGGNA